ncbi:expansin EXLX1 family cellulose-binding protein [Acetivibrio clariflavus]|uniref:Endoglucanase-like protein n=1 Tax=Acetivibrio clariflavus (strain DSM 19732 / NBRC 101661 / EBR45) TaxID=720554 RepID=G8LZP9_ACECE|nr:expansin EXLX1 family cellulose-binding protein [Acetivibrio clariflavus]AEV67950.1 endoglucanase-like protein [Acetivibrio clariflavus DSM 19732]
MNFKKIRLFTAILIIAAQVLSYNFISSAQLQVGDVNGDNNVDSIDFALMKSFILKIINTLPAEDSLLAGDLDGDGSINSIDCALMKQYLLGMIKVFPKTQSPAPTPTNTPLPEYSEPYPGWDKIRSGYATYTGSGYVGGIALLDPIPEDMEIVAVNKPDFNCYGVQAALAGAYLEVTGPKGTTVVYVTDCYTEAPEGALDLCGISCDKIGDTNVPGGKIDVTWRIIPAPITGNFIYRILPASSKWWFAIQVRNHKYPVMKMEYFKDGEWVDIPKDRCNYFVINNLDTSNLKIRITDIRGKVVTDIIDPIPDNLMNGCFIQGNVQFPD